MIQIKVILLLAVFVVASCSTIPEQPSSQPSADPTTANPPAEVSEETSKKPHTHEEHPADDPDHSDHPGHENDPKPVKVAKHHGGDHDHSVDEKVSDGHDHSHDEQADKVTDSQEQKAKPTPGEEIKESDNETQENRFKRGLWRRRLE